MKIEANTIEEYLSKLPEDRKIVIEKLRDIINKNIPKGFQETLSYNMIGWVVPHSLYPKGYHCDTKLPLPFMNIASQKNFVAVYHMGIYADKKLFDWFTSEYAKIIPTKIDMGKSCLRLKKMDQIPYQLIGELASIITTDKWIEMYESAFVKSN